MAPCRIVGFVLVAWLITHSTEAGGRIGPIAYLRQLRFSPDGRYVLAQDDARIYVLTVRPFATLLRIPTENATDAQFTPDSQEIVFIDSTTRADTREIKFAKSVARVERWSIAGAVRSSSVELTAAPCDSQRLSPDGKVLACVDFEGTLRVMDIRSGEVFLEKKRFGREYWSFTNVSHTAPTPRDPAGIEQTNTLKFPADPGSAEFDFSPGAEYLVAIPEINTENALLCDLPYHRRLPLRRALSLLTVGWRAGPGPNGRVQFFAFVAPSRLLVSSLWWAKHELVTARLIQVPSGKLLSKPKLPPGPILAAADPSFVIVRPFGRSASQDSPQRAAGVELATGEVIISQTPALDVLGRHYVAQPSPGVVGLYGRGKGLQATVELEKK